MYITGELVIISCGKQTGLVAKRNTFFVGLEIKMRIRVTDWLT